MYRLTTLYVQSDTSNDSLINIRRMNIDNPGRETRVVVPVHDRGIDHQRLAAMLKGSFGSSADIDEGGFLWLAWLRSIAFDTLHVLDTTIGVIIGLLASPRDTLSATAFVDVPETVQTGHSACCGALKVATSEVGVVRHPDQVSEGRAVGHHDIDAGKIRDMILGYGFRVLYHGVSWICYKSQRRVPCVIQNIR